MTYLQPFFLLMGRVSVFWVGAAVLIGLTFVLAGVGQPDEITAPYVDPVFLATFAFPAAAGWLAGAIIQEFLHCSIAWALPSVLKRVAAGFVTTGLTLSLAVAALGSQSPASSLGFVTLLTIGLAGYGLGGNLFGPRNRWLGWIDFAVVALVVVRSQYLSDLAIEYPLPAMAISLALALFGISRLFSRSLFRRRAFSLATPFPGSHSLERSISYDRQKLTKNGPTGMTWSTGYLGTATWNWVRAAIRAYGPLGWKTIPRVLSRLWVLALLFSIYAWSDKGDLGFGEAFGKTIYTALFSSPHVPAFGLESDRHPIVILVISALGVVLALWAPTDLKTSLAYPLSRQKIAAVTHRVGLVGAFVFIAGIFLVLSIVGHLAGWLVSYPLRFDFMPFFLYPLMATVVLLPLALWGRLHLQVATQRKTENTLVAVIFGVLGFVAMAWILTAVTSRLFGGAMMQISVSILLFLLSQDIYRRKLRKYFSTADLI